MRRRIFSFALVLCLLCTMLPMTVYAATTVASGECGDNMSWNLDSNGNLTILGTGEMYDYSPYSKPWENVKDQILSISVAEGVTSIGEDAFYSCGDLRNISLPEGLTNIGGHAFASCVKMRSITLPDSVTSLGNGVFYSCENLASIELSDNLIDIGNYTFAYCKKLTSIEVPAGVTAIGNTTFNYCSGLTSIKLPDNLTSIGNSAFANCHSLTSIELPDSVTSIGDGAFSSSGLTSIELPDGITNIGNNTFAQCDLTSLELPNSVTRIGENAFQNCSDLSNITLLDNLTSIGYGAFRDCDILSSITIPASVTFIDEFAFADCDALTQAVFSGEAPEISYDVFLNVTATCYYPANDPTWTSDVLQDYGGDLTWVPVESASAGYQVAFDGYKGDHFGGEFEIDGSYFTRLNRQENCAAGEKLEDVLEFTITRDPQWEGMTFEGWLMYEEEGIEQGGPFYLQSGDLYTTDDVMQHTVPDYNVRYVAKWAEIPMSYYENLYDPYWGVGDNEEQSTGISVWAHGLGMEASFTVLKDGVVLERNRGDWYEDLAEGETLASKGYGITDLEFWDPSRNFDCWNGYIFVEGQGMVEIEDAQNLTTSQMLAYPSLGSPQIQFTGQWAGEESEYYSSIGFDGYGGTYEVCFGGEPCYTTSWENWNCRERDDIISAECGRYWNAEMYIQNVEREGNEFWGWIEYTVINGNYQMASDQPVDTMAVISQYVPEDDKIFVARWSNVPWEEYENYGSGGGGYDDINHNVTVTGGWYGRFVTMKNGEFLDGVSGAMRLQIPVGSSLMAEGYEFVDWEPYPEHAGEIRNRTGWYVGTHDGDRNFVRFPGSGLLSDSEMLNYTIPADQKISFEAQWDEEPDGGDVPIDGYVASITADEEVSNGDRILALVKAKHSEESVFAAGEVVVSYDSSMLTFNQEASNLGNATVKDDNGILILEDYGEDKLFSNTAYVLAFDTKGTGTVTLNLESAAFVNKENAVKSDLIPAALDPASAVVTISRSRYPVALDEIFNGPATATDGESYTFYAADMKHYVYDSVSVMMGGNPAPVTDNGDGSYTVASVNGPLTVTGSRSEKEFKVIFEGSGAEDITNVKTTATYGIEYVFDLPSEDGVTYTLEQILIDGQVYTDYIVTGNTITIDGMHIHGDMVITITKTVAEATVTVEGNGAGAAAGYVTEVELGAVYVLSLNPAAGYTYTVTATMNGEPAEVVDNGDNTYTIEKVTGDIVFTVTRSLVTDGVTVSQYLKINGANVWIIKFAAEVEDGKVPTYDGNPMFWSDEYDAYCYLEITEVLNEEEAKTKLDITDGTAPTLGESMDVNGSGKVDASDAQLVYNMYNAMYTGFDGDVTVEKYLRADVNKDGEINVQDAAAIIAHVLA